LRIHQALVDEGAVPRFVGPKLGAVSSATGDPIEVEVSLDAAPAVLWDASVFVDGEAASDALSQLGQAIEFLQNQYRHCKPILLLGSANGLLEKANIPSSLLDGTPDAALLQLAAEDVDLAVAPFVEAITNHRYFQRETNPPRV
jgi:catalase